MFILFCYVSPGNTLKNKRKIDLFELLTEETNRFKEKGAILINGDLNARTGQNKDVNLNIENIYNLPLRNSKDIFINARGNDLLDSSKANDYLIINGWKVGDIFAKHTFPTNGTGQVFFWFFYAFLSRDDDNPRRVN